MLKDHCLLTDNCTACLYVRRVTLTTVCVDLAGLHARCTAQCKMFNRYDPIVLWNMLIASTAVIFGRRMFFPRQ